MQNKNSSIWITLIIIVGVSFVLQSLSGAKKVEKSVRGPVTVLPVSHATMVLGWGDQVIYTDPVGGAEAFKGQKQATLVLVTDVHGDHLSTTTLTAILGDAKFVVPQAVKVLLPEELAKKAIVLKNGETITLNGLQITGVPMYNVPESKTAMHAKGRGNGYVIVKDGYQVYVAGDTAGTPEMRALKNIDIAFIPMNLPYTMSVEDAADAVLAFSPKVVYPYHYRGKNGLSDIQKFKTLVSEKSKTIEVILLNWYPKQ